MAGVWQTIAAENLVRHVSGTYYLSAKVGGKKIRRSLGTSDSPDGEDQARRPVGPAAHGGGRGRGEQCPNPRGSTGKSGGGDPCRAPPETEAVLRSPGKSDRAEGGALRQGNRGKGKLLLPGHTGSQLKAWLRFGQIAKVEAPKPAAPPGKPPENPPGGNKPPENPPQPPAK